MICKIGLPLGLPDDTRGMKTAFNPFRPIAASIRRSLLWTSARVKPEFRTLFNVSQTETEGTYSPIFRAFFSCRADTDLDFGSFVVRLADGA